MAFCQNCGAQLANGQNFCPSCGTRVASAADQNAYRSSPNMNYDPAGAYNAAPNYEAPFYPSRGPAAPVSFPQKNIVTCIILSVVTCGIYGIIWFIDMVNNLNEASGDTTAQPGTTVFLLGLVTCGIYYLIWMYKAGDQLNGAKASRGLPTEQNANIMYLLLSIIGLGIVAYALIQSELNKIAAMYGAPPA